MFPYGSASSEKVECSYKQEFDCDFSAALNDDRRALAPDNVREVADFSELVCMDSIRKDAHRRLGTDSRYDPKDPNENECRRR